MAYDKDLREEEIKNKVASDCFADFDCTQIIGNIDFCVTIKTEGEELFEVESLLWAEAKQGTNEDIYASFVQLILTIGKSRVFNDKLPPKYLGAFDAEKIAFIPYNSVLDIFYQNDFNWNVRPSDHNSKEFKQVYQTVHQTLTEHMSLFDYERDAKELSRFIKSNFKEGKQRSTAIRITKNNFTTVYQRWAEIVKPTIGMNWELGKKNGILDADFFLADLLSEHNISLKEKLYVLLRENRYQLDRKIDEYGLLDFRQAEFTDGQEAHQIFWNRYHRPPKREYWDYIVGRRDLLVPQDVRERKGSFFTPQKWVALSQQYLEDVLGEDWQDEYYIWDCAAGTGNLLNGLTNKFNIWASTLDKADVDVMHERVKNGANLLESHIFQFDFLNDSFDKLPKGLKEIIDDEEKRKKLVIYINPPYAEATNAKTVVGTGGNKKGESNQTMIGQKYALDLGLARKELFAQFFIRVAREIPGSVLAEFSTLKILLKPNFKVFRENFRAKLKKGFIVPAKTFDNVTGTFPIGFMIWDLSKEEVFVEEHLDEFEANGEYIQTECFQANDDNEKINVWIAQFKTTSEKIAELVFRGTDFQHSKFTCIVPNDYVTSNTKFAVSKNNLLECSIYFTVKLLEKATWINDGNQFRYPKDGWEEDNEFQGNCLAFTLFHGQNRIQSSEGVNHWIPFTEAEVNAKDNFASHFMTDYIKAFKQGTIKFPSLGGVPRSGGVVQNNGVVQEQLFEEEISAETNEKTTPSGFACHPSKGGELKGRPNELEPFEFSEEAKAVFDTGRELWTYYHSQDFAPNTYNPNASLYDIRAYFQGFNEKGNMNKNSNDPIYTALIGKLRARLKDLAKAIEPKVYEYEFLKS